MLKRNMRNRVNLSIFDVRLIEVPLSIVFWISRFCMINVLADKTMYYQTSPCPNYSPWKKAIAISGAVLRSSGEFHGDCRITFQVPYPDRQRFLLRFESVGIQECHDRLVIYDSDDLVDAVRLEEISCRSQVDPTRFMYTSNKGGYVTIRYYTYNKGEHASEFRLVLTAINKLHRLGKF
ncbi:hypothetical protein RvY_06981-3 [Ramazzottius varieornatus]|uniref:CUB domain-containing protein n=1 Tax=Ramazzottius varieornatus TaxID=947166 RepID=A0A1D1V0F9_RAMVA|nr:hypothetical protein RvY_06981-3 [Ramazzottius varieornatus]